MLAHLRNGDTYARLGAGFGISATTAWWYDREAVDVLAPTTRRENTSSTNAA